MARKTMSEDTDEYPLMNFFVAPPVAGKNKIAIPWPFVVKAANLGALKT
ncbi:hypothetical protein [[Actinomadura] parvosata]|nr:hypothetical protein [Nonomuraea sp. ATCC 55076]